MIKCMFSPCVCATALSFNVSTRIQVHYFSWSLRLVLLRAVVPEGVVMTSFLFSIGACLRYGGL